MLSPQLELHLGDTRIVLLVFNLAFKIPRLNSWRLFLQGLLANLQEVEWSRIELYDSSQRVNRLCPVLGYLSGGWLTVMPRCRELSLSDWERFLPSWPDFVACSPFLPVACDRTSFGWLGSRLVAVDFS